MVLAYGRLAVRRVLMHKPILFELLELRQVMVAGGCVQMADAVIRSRGFLIMLAK